MKVVQMKTILTTKQLTEREKKEQQSCVMVDHSRTAIKLTFLVSSNLSTAKFPSKFCARIAQESAKENKNVVKYVNIGVVSSRQV